MSKVNAKLAQLVEANRVADEAAQADVAAHEARWAEYNRAHKAEKAAIQVRRRLMGVALRIRREVIQAVRREVATLMQPTATHAAELDLHIVGYVQIGEQEGVPHPTISVTLYLVRAPMTPPPGKLGWMESTWDLNRMDAPIVSMGTTYAKVGVLPMLMSTLLEALP